MKPGTILGERFERERRVSAGGMSAAVRARDLRLCGLVALKVPYGRDEAEHRERLVREASVLARLRHPGTASSTARAFLATRAAQRVTCTGADAWLSRSCR